MQLDGYTLERFRRMRPEARIRAIASIRADFIPGNDDDAKRAALAQAFVMGILANELHTAERRQTTSLVIRDAARPNRYMEWQAHCDWVEAVLVFDKKGDYRCVTMASVDARRLRDFLNEHVEGPEVCRAMVSGKPCVLPDGHSGDCECTAECEW